MSERHDVGPDPDKPRSGTLRSAGRKLLGSLLREHRRPLAVAAGLLLVQDVASLAGPYLVKIGIDAGVPPLAGPDHDPTTLCLVGLGFVVLALVRYAAKRGFLVLSGRIGQAVLLELRRRVYNHFQRLSIGFHERYSSGQVIARLTSDVDTLSDLLEGALDDLVVAALSVVSVAAMLIWLDGALALVTMVSVPFLLALSWWFHTAGAAAYPRTRERVSLVINYFVESVGAIRAVQAFRRERRNERLFAAANDEYQRANLRAMRLLAVFVPGVKLIGNTTLAVVLTYGGYRVLSGRLELGVLAAFLLYVRRFFEPMQELSDFYDSFQAAVAALAKLAGVLSQRPMVTEPPHPVALPRAGIAGEIRLTGVRFGYREGYLVLPGLDLTIPPGQTVALVGATGAGKSTVAKLITRFYDPGSGSVTLDGVDLRRIAQAELRRAVVMIAQEDLLFSGTIADNIGFGRPDASQQEIIRAANALGAHQFISALPDGYDTQIHRRGITISAGQRQLIGFARAFLADPAVLLLDEATSALDIPSERLVQRALRTMLAGRTAIVIAHRICTVEIADRVLVIDNGHIIEDGSPTELSAAGGPYAHLHRRWLDGFG